MIMHSYGFGLVDFADFLFFVHLNSFLVGVLVDLGLSLTIFVDMVSPYFVIDSAE